jgi:hypothetical protein
MEIYGIKVEFARTVKSNAALAEICPDHDIKRFGEMVSGNAYWINIPKIMEIMQNGAEDKKKFDAAQMGQTYEPQYLTEEQFSYLDAFQLNVLSNECWEAFVGDGKQTVDSKEKAGKKT